MSWFRQPIPVRAQEGTNDIKAELEEGKDDIELLGPVESPIYKRGKLFRYQLLLKFPVSLEPPELLGGVNDFMKRSKGLYIRIDVDPVSFM